MVRNMASSKSCHIPGNMRQGLSFLTPNLEGSESKARKTMEGKLKVSTKPFFLTELEEKMTEGFVQKSYSV